jgi:hypothetical protein
MESSSSTTAQHEFYRELVAANADDWLQPAYDVACGASGHVGEEHGRAPDPDHGLAQIDALGKWARRAGLVFESEPFPRRLKGGREHWLVDPLETSDRIVKVTIGPEFGFYAACLPKSRYRDVCHWFTTVEGTPLQYLRRLLLLNELFPRCHTRLAGFIVTEKRMHAVTAQLIAQGRPASLAEISDWMRQNGFRFISAWTWFRPADGVALFDVLEKNVMRCDDGEIVPFDVIPIRCEGIFLEMMHAAAERML